MRKLRAPVVCFCLSFALAAAVPAGAAAAQATDGDEAHRIVETFYNDLYARKFADALSDIKDVNPDSSNPDGQAIIAAMRASALLGLKDESAAQKQIAQIDQHAPTNPDAWSILFEGALFSDHYAVSAAALDTIIARFPDVARQLDEDYVWIVLRNEPEGEERRNEDRRIQLARIGFGGELRGDYLAKEAVRILVGRGDWSGALDYLREIDDPQLIEDLLIQKRYSRLWPTLEEMAGPHLEKVRKSSASTAERAYSEASDNPENLALLTNALRHSGMLDDAIDLRSKLPQDSKAMSSADEQTGWAINNIALALHEKGRADEADALFAMLNDAPMPTEYWRVSMKINRLELLVLDGKFDKALPLIEPTAKTEGSPYAEQLVRRLRFCTLSRLGRTKEAATFLPDMLAHAADAPGPTIDGLLCVGDLDKAEQVALEALKNPDDAKRTAFEEDFVRQLQSRRLTSDDPSVWQERWQELRRRPAIAGEFDRLGRDMPDALLPPQAVAANTK